MGQLNGPSTHRSCVEAGSGGGARRGVVISCGLAVDDEPRDVGVGRLERHRCLCLEHLQLVAHGLGCKPWLCVPHSRSVHARQGIGCGVFACGIRLLCVSDLRRCYHSLGGQVMGMAKVGEEAWENGQRTARGRGRRTDPVDAQMCLVPHPRAVLGVVDDASPGNLCRGEDGGLDALKGRHGLLQKEPGVASDSVSSTGCGQPARDRKGNGDGKRASKVKNRRRMGGRSYSR